MNFLNNIPQVTKNLMILNVLFFLVTLFLESKGINLRTILGAHYLNSPDFQPYQAITHMFIHENFLHILMNMWLFVMLGGHLERLWGPKRFFIFYILCGLGAFILHNGIGVYQIYELRHSLSMNYPMESIDNIIRNTSDANTVDALNSYFNEKQLASGEGIQRYFDLTRVTMFGASGAVFGVLAAFAILFPNMEFLLYFAIPVKAKYLFGAYILLEIYLSFKNSPTDQVAHLAHLVGAIVGAIMVLYWRKTDRSNFY
jgi:membrane associated rhomboid family serine protease